MFSTSSPTYAFTMTATASTATISVPTKVQRPLFASLANKTSDPEDLLHPGFYPVPAISKLGRGRQPCYALRQQSFPAAALASAISRKLPTLAQMISEEAADMEDTDVLFALIASTNETLLAPTPITPVFPRATISTPIHVPNFSFNSFNGTTSLDASRPHSRGSSSSSASSFEYESNAEFDFEDDADIDDDASVSSVSSVESCFDFLASTKPQSQTGAHSPSPLQVPVPMAHLAPPTAPAALFVPPQVRANMNMLRFTRARAQSTDSNDSIFSGTSSAGSWRSSASSAFSTSSRASISSLSSVSSSPIHKAKPASHLTTPSASTPAPASASQAAKTKYLYQGGVSTVLGGGVMLGGTGSKPRQNRQAPKTATRAPTSTYNATTNTTVSTSASTWRRCAPASMLSRA